MAERTTIRLPEGLLKQAKHKAAKEGCTLTSLIEEGLRRVIAENPAQAARIIPRISKAKGRQMPGIDLDDMSSIQEMEDLEYIERMKRFK